MDSPAKRRKTLPGAGPGSAPATPSRASYLSPTKASLSRYNPSLLPAPRSSPARRERDDREQRKSNALEYVLGAADDLKGSGQKRKRIDGGEQVDAFENQEADAQLAMEETEPEVQAPENARRARYEIRESHTTQLLDEDEDDLPETPQKLISEWHDTPPRGILYSTPRRRRKQKETQKAAIQEDVNGETVTGAEPPAQEPEARLEVGLTPSEQLALEEKQSELTALRKELRGLEEETRKFEHHIKLNQTIPADAPYKGLDELINLAAGSNSNSNPAVAIQPPLSTLLTAFLPFSIPLPDLPPAYEETAEDPIPSHAPLPATPELLTLFTPLSVSSIISPPSKPLDSTAPISQLHTLTLEVPSALLTATLALTISSDPMDPQNPTISELKVRNLSSWADREVGDWIRQREAECDVAAIGYGLGRYYTVSLKRAECWVKLCRTFPHLIPGLPPFESASGTSAAKGSVARGKRRARDMDDDQQGSEGDDIQQAISGTELSRHLSRDSLTIQSKQVALRISWPLSFDWTGEIQSRVGAKATFPSICKLFCVLLRVLGRANVNL
jgi:hypothetical protein